MSVWQPHAPLLGCPAGGRSHAPGPKQNNHSESKNRAVPALHYHDPPFPVYTSGYTVYFINCHLSLPCPCQPNYLLNLGYYVHPSQVSSSLDHMRFQPVFNSDTSVRFSIPLHSADQNKRNLVSFTLLFKKCSSVFIFSVSSFYFLYLVALNSRTTFLSCLSNLIIMFLILLATTELKDFFAKARNGSVRLIKIVIEDGKSC